jgi:hypothetical protein
LTVFISNLHHSSILHDVGTAVGTVVRGLVVRGREGEAVVLVMASTDNLLQLRQRNRLEIHDLPPSNKETVAPTAAGPSSAIEGAHLPLQPAQVLPVTAAGVCSAEDG